MQSAPPPQAADRVHVRAAAPDGRAAAAAGRVGALRVAGEAEAEQLRVPRGAAVEEGRAVRVRGGEVHAAAAEEPRGHAAAAGREVLGKVLV